ncbi:hypothetical protein [Alteromonas sp. 14N.309.X.WAT.G.H12]|uniref:hypothetical protein n=1 Tax=Alteromonas sp. 14N.309.X.WAT.G.H12 TaxID=3120824 RepID=UPI002FCF834B
MIRLTCALIAATSVATLSGCSSAPRQVTPTYYVDAVVVDFKRAPKICYVKRKSSNSSGKTLLGILGGGAVGYLIGKNIGSGSGKDIATGLFTVGGAVVGGAAMVEPSYTPRTGEKLDCKSNGYKATLVYRHPESGMVITESRLFKSRPSKDTEVNIPVLGKTVWQNG